MIHLVWFVEHVYPFLVPIVIVAATFIVVLKRERTLVFPFLISLLLVFGVFYVTRLYAIFFLSLPTMFVTLWIPVLLAAYFAYAVRWGIRRSRS